MAFTKIAAAGIGSTETVTLHSLEVLNNATVGGVLTYEDVTNVDSIGIITARAGVLVGSGITLSKDGDVFFTGIATGNGSGLTALNASNISSGTVPTARLGSGTASSSTFLRGDSTFQTVNTDLVSDTSPQLGGNLDVNTKNIVFGDSSDGSSDDVLKFGAGSDLAIYHDSVHSRIVDTGTGDLKLQTSKLTVGNAGNSETMAVFTENGASELYHDNSKKIETAKTGAVVTGILTATTFVPSEGQLSNRNLIINGAMRVAQRGTSSTSDGYRTVDRFRPDSGGEDETPTQTQEPLGSSSTGPYEKGFRNYLRIRNGNQTSGAGAADYIQIEHRMEAQDLATSGWNYTSSSSFITLSFWVRSSVSKKFQITVKAYDGTSQSFQFETPTLSANTWTKVVKTIPGNSNLQFDTDVNIGLSIFWFPYIGTDYTDAGNTLDGWQASSGSTYGVVDGTSWYTTNDATFDITGVQLEVGQSATPFEHRSFGEDLALCQRYLFKNINESGESGCNYAKAFSTSELFTSVKFPVAMRATPTITAYGNSGGAGTVHKLGILPDKSYSSIDRQDVYGGFRFNSGGNWATGDTDMYSFTFQAEAEL